MLRLGLIGCGGMAGTHARRFEATAHRMRVTATADIDLAKAQEVASSIGAGRAVADYRELLDDSVDAVLIATPHHLHHEQGMAAIEAGKHVLMEKPLANSERQCLDLIEAAERKRVTLMVAYPMPYHPLCRQFEELVLAKTYGETFHLSMWTEQLTKFDPDAWFCKVATLGGGQLFSHGCHYVDLLLRYLGEPVLGTHVGTNFGTEWMEREGTSDVSIKFANGAIGFHEGTWGARGTKLLYAFHAIATEGTIELDLRHGRLVLHQGISETVLVEDEPFTKHVEAEMNHFIDSVENRTRPLTDGRRSLQSLRVIWRLYEAEERGTVADLRGLGIDNADTYSGAPLAGATA